jgi:hypothetical protein
VVGDVFFPGDIFGLSSNDSFLKRSLTSALVITIPNEAGKRSPEANLPVSTSTESSIRKDVERQTRARATAEKGGENAEKEP